LPKWSLESVAGWSGSRVNGSEVSNFVPPQAVSTKVKISIATKPPKQEIVLMYPRDSQTGPVTFCSVVCSEGSGANDTLMRCARTSPVGAGVGVLAEGWRACSFVNPARHAAATVTRRFRICVKHLDSFMTCPHGRSPGLSVIVSVRPPGAGTPRDLGFAIRYCSLTLPRRSCCKGRLVSPVSRPRYGRDRRPRCRRAGCSSPR
jgi:hypothetical protein